MANVDLNDANVVVDTGNDSIVIINFIEGITGGRTLDVTGFIPKVIQGGHIVIKDVKGEYKPMPVTDNAYAALPTNHTVEGVVVTSVLTSKPMAAIMVRGSVNQVASPYPVTAEIKAALPLIRFTQD